MRVVGASLLFAVVTAIAPASAGAAQRWSAPTAARTSGPCVAVDPCTLAAALAGAATGDEILLAPGTYPMPAPLTASVRVTLRGAEAGRPVIVGNETSEDHAVLTFRTGGTLRHVEIHATQGEQDALTLQGGVAEDVVLSAAGGDGAKVVGDSGGTVLRDAVVRTAAQGDDNAALKLRESGGPGDVMLRNVTALAPGANGIRCEVTAGTATLVNTLVRGGKTDVKATSSSRCSAAHSNFRPAASPYMPAGSGNQDSTPLLDADARPLSGSPTIDAGTTDPLVGATDLAGCPRTLGAATDIGAYEYTTGACTVDAPPPVTPDPPAVGTPPGTPDALPPADTHADLPPGIAPPTQGKTMVVSPGQGKVLVRKPGTSRFRELEAGAQIPVGSEIDTRKGRVTLVTAVAGGLQDGTFWGGRFTVSQRRAGDGMTSLVLKGGSFKGCPKAARASAAAASKKKKKKPVRKLWAEDDNGRFRTHGHNSVATARGTRWVTEDSCDGTRTRVLEGAVAVRDVRRKRTTLVRAGHSFLARR